MKIYLADYAGFCFGVERAINIVKEQSNIKDNVRTLGPIIHNPQVVKQFEDNGVLVESDAEKLDSSHSVVLRSHGITKSTYEKLKKNNVDIIDATCPFVNKAHAEAAKLSGDGYDVVVLGEADHPEVKGIVSYIKGKYHVISDEKDIEDIDLDSKVGLIAQTTQNREVFNRVRRALEHRAKELKVVNTICNATNLRQHAAKKLAKSVDLMLVIGGKNSGNTTRLFKICRELCTNTYHIETASELTKDMFDNIENIGITAGASTPDFLIEEVLEYINEVNDAGEQS